MSYMERRKNDHTENLRSAILASGDSCGIGAFIPEGSQKQCGSVGGEMVKRMVQQYEQGLK